MKENDERKNLEERAQYVRRGGSLDIFKPADVAELQTYAVQSMDSRLYFVLETFWRGKKPAAAHSHKFEVLDCARPAVCACGEVQP